MKRSDNDTNILYAKFVPSDMRVCAYAQCPDFFTIGEYLDMFTGPLTFSTLESELVWPAPKMIKY